MKSMPLVSAAVALAVLGPSVAAAARGSVPVKARLTMCRTAQNPFARAVAYRASMLPIPGARRLAIRDDLLARPVGGSRFAPLHAQGLGAFQSRSVPGRSAKIRYARDHDVNNLAAGTYRFRLTFRWSDARGHVLKTVQRRTATCFQPELRPDLRFLGTIHPTAVPGHPRQTRYEADVKNAGGTRTGTFDVAFSVPGMPARSKSVGPIPPGGVSPVRFTGPVCTEGTSLTFTLDPAQSVRESDEANNSLTATCSASSPSP